MYTTLGRVVDELKAGDQIAPSGSQQQIMGFIRTVTRRVDAFGFAFEPLYYTKNITPCPENVDTWLATLQLGDFLLEPLSIVVGPKTVNYGSDVLNYPNNGQTPIQTLRIAQPCNGPLRSWYPSCFIPNTYIESIQITGFWGVRTAYTSLGWLPSGMTCPALDNVQTSLNLTSVPTTDALGRTPVFSPGNLLRIDNEMMEVYNVSVSGTTTTLYVSRGARGTAAAAHSSGVAITIFEVEDGIVNEVTRQVGLLYARRGAYQAVTTFPEGVNVTYPSDLLPALRGAIQGYNYL